MEDTTAVRLQARIHHIDYNLVPPGALDNSTLPRVPVLRIYGASTSGQTACIHVHQVYPYFYVEYSGQISPRHVNRYTSKLSRSLDHAVALSLRRNPESSKSRYIRAIILVKGVDFYGFHASYKPYLKVLVADPSLVSRVVAILQSGSVMGNRFRIFESHLSYVLQFMCDFDLHGCGVINLEHALERGPQAEDDDSSQPTTAPLFGLSPYFRESRVQLEVDAIAPHIFNRHRLTARHLHHKLEIPAPLLPPEPLILSVRELWDDERKRRQALGLDPSPEIPADPSESSRAPGAGWISEARWWDEIKNRIQHGETSLDPAVDSKWSEWHHGVMTTFESVEAIWEKQYRSWKPLKKLSKVDDGKPQDAPVDYNWDSKTISDQEVKDEQIDVDISMLSTGDMSQIDQEDDLNWRDGILGDLNDDDAENEDEDPTMEDEVNDDTGPVEQDTVGSTVDPFVDEGLENDNKTSAEYRLPSPHIPESRASGSRLRSESPSRPETDVQHQESIMESHNAMYEGKLEEQNKSSNLELHSPSEIRVNEVTENSLSHQDGTLKESAGYDEEVKEGDASPLVEKTTQGPTPSDRERTTRITARAVKLSKVFNSFKAENRNRHVYGIRPPTRLELKHSMKTLDIPSKLYKAPYYSRDEDIPELPKEFAGLTFHLKGGQGIAHLDDWETDTTTDEELYSEVYTTPELNPTGVGGWEYAHHPPSIRELRQTMFLITDDLDNKAEFKSQIEGPTQANIYGFNTSPAKPINQEFREAPTMSILSVEIFVPTIKSKVPNPETDSVAAILYAHITRENILQTGAIVIEDSPLDRQRMRPPNTESVQDEVELLNRLIDLVVDFDPDIVTGWEVQNNSWGFLNSRGNFLNLPLSEMVSRAPPRNSGDKNEQWSFRKTSVFKVTGRHVLNLWRVMRTERTLTIYSFENVVFDVLRRRVPYYSYQTLTAWYHSDTPVHQSYLFQHLQMRAVTNLQLLEETEMVTKTAEFARVFGIDFFEVISRGSQFKVESFMFRLAKPESFVLISPSKVDVGGQNGAECMPLIMEPESAFYSDPLLVLDFQSLYPSIMIAYNYCYSTCLGRISMFQGKNKFGVVDDLQISPDLVEKLQSHINVAPNGMMYVKAEVRKGLLGRMLVELLETRVMVKQAMKRVGDDKVRKKVLNARQLSLKYIANVTYGYTSASFSGRMPAVEIADSIVQSGRETLEKAIDVIESTKKWGAKVVYGDTDSVFVYLPGRTKAEAFTLGYEIADTITAMNPAPIKLKFEKIYLPCVLMAKKRYVGFKYESLDDTEPVFDAKGIETIRRDGVLAQRKMVENCLKILFRSQDLSEVKDYCCRSWTKLLENRASAQDFIFAKEVKMGTYSDKAAPPPGVVVAARRMIIDPHDEVQYNDRLPYVIVRSSTAVKLADRAMHPLDFMNDSSLHLDATYYITRVLIPPLERIFNLVGADVKQWFNEMPKTVLPEIVSPRKPRAEVVPSSLDRINIGEHFGSTQCLSCGEPATESLCDGCLFAAQETIVNLHARIRTKEERMENTHRICASCTGHKASTGLELVPMFEQLARELESLQDEIENEFEGDEEADSDMYAEDTPSAGEIEVYETGHRIEIDQ
ncbi:hypothetical protein D9619_003181 [Psilocybe cf. subviscida]|uniref:DNA polymerase n=1 Tax=Psilocybe cf. subviscida TaxID=2480587 RepID=A0A8H5AY70_9AGAR|nr:hypothetical protein D9619_003181 [Psilocybe cf. subviscida]